MRDGPAASPGTRGSVVRRGEPARHRGLRVVSSLATAVTLLLVAVGALVRATGSGEGCSGWPKCSATSWLPPLRYHAIVEYSHRMTAFLAIVLVLALAAVALRRYRRVPRVAVPATGAVALILVQAVLGGIAVRTGLSPAVVTAHLGTAMVLVGVLVYVTVAAFTVDAVPTADGFVALARATAGATFVLLLIGGYVRGAGAGLAFLDWPLMDGRVVPPLGTTQAGAMFTHRLAAAVVGVLVVVLAVRALRERRARPAAANLAFIALGLFLAQVLIGAANVWTRLSQPAVFGHVAVSALVWAALLATAAVASATAAPSRAGGGSIPSEGGGAARSRLVRAGTGGER